MDSNITHDTSPLYLQYLYEGEVSTVWIKVFILPRRLEVNFVSMYMSKIFYSFAIFSFFVPFKADLPRYLGLLLALEIFKYVVVSA